MDASQYKDYVLVLLFVKYVSDKYAGKKNAEVIIPEGGSFKDLVKLKGKPNIGEGINVVLSKLAEANGLKGVIDAVDFNDEDKLGKGKEMQDRLSNLIAIFENSDLDFSRNRAEGDDLLGDAYEYLMKNFAVESGKSKGQFYTPAEVSRVMAKVIGADKATSRSQTVYDPTCGSGSLLLKVAAETPKGITIYGQELENTTAALAIMNMWLHDQPTAEIRKGQSTLSNPLFFNTDGSLKAFDFVVANPPFSYKAWRNGFDPEHDKYERFTGFGIPPAKNGDFAFLLHIIRSMKSTAKGAVILPHGVLFRGNAEAEIRRNIIKRGYIKGIIGLPPNLFYGTGIPACIIVLDKGDAASRKGIFMIDASRGFIKDGNKNRLREQDIKKIVDVFNKQIEIPGYSRFVHYEEIQKNDYNLNIPRYIPNLEEEDEQDIEAHLKGGIPNKDIERLFSYWQVCPTLKELIFKPFGRDGYSKLAISEDDIKKTILSHSEFIAFRKEIFNTFENWTTKTTTILKNLTVGFSPKKLIGEISENLLAAFETAKLIDNYDIYQYLMDYWRDVMQDDVYIIAQDGWLAGKQVIRLQKEGKGKKKDIEGLSGLEGRLIPVSLIISEYFKQEKEVIDELQDELDQIRVKMDELKEEHSGDEGLLSEVINEKDKISKTAVQKRIKEIKNDSEFSDELAVLKEYLLLFEKEAEIKKEIKEKEKVLEQKVIAKYPTLSEDEIKTLVVDKKWIRTLRESILSEIDKLSQKLATRIKELTQRYEQTLPEIESQVKEFKGKVEEHLKKMRFEL